MSDVPLLKKREELLKELSKQERNHTHNRNPLICGECANLLGKIRVFDELVGALKKYKRFLKNNIKHAEEEAIEHAEQIEGELGYTEEETIDDFTKDFRNALDKFVEVFGE